VTAPPMPISSAEFGVKDCAHRSSNERRVALPRLFVAMLQFTQQEASYWFTVADAASFISVAVWCRG
jgi:hypothetical protein